MQEEEIIISKEQALELLDCGVSVESAEEAQIKADIQNQALLEEINATHTKE